MMLKSLAAGVLGLAAASAFAQALPTEISGRWFWKARNVGQSYSLEDIRRADDGSVTAKLTWYTIDSKCAIRGEPVRGSLADGVLSFDAKTHCDVAFKLSLKADGAAWAGTATTVGGAQQLVLDVTGK
jgi:hypothetical protein